MFGSLDCLIFGGQFDFWLQIHSRLTKCYLWGFWEATRRSNLLLVDFEIGRCGPH